MSAVIYQLPTPLVGTVNTLPNFKFMVTGNDLDTITAAAYLNQVDLQSNPVLTTDILQVLYSFDPVTQVGTYGYFTVSIDNGIITLVVTDQPGDVILPVLSDYMPAFIGTAGTLGMLDNGDNYLLNGDIVVRADTPYSLRLNARSNPSNSSTTISSAVPLGQNTTYYMVDPGSANGTFPILPGAPSAITSGNLIIAGSNAGVITDSGVAVSDVLKVGGTNIMTANGTINLFKGTASGNALSTVILNRQAGLLNITVENIVPLGATQFTLSNSLLLTSSTILLTTSGPVYSSASYTTLMNGSVVIYIYNLSNEDPLDGVVGINFTIF